MQNKNQIKSYILDYLQKVVPNFQKKAKMFTCPQCGKVSANIFPPHSHKVFCYSPDCQSIGDIFKICRKLEFDNNKDIPNEDIAKHLIEMFDIKTDTHINKLLEQYASWGWDLVPIANDKKIPIEKNWTQKHHKDIREWQKWLNNKSGLGVKTGAISNTIGIDVDLITKEESEIWQKGTATKKIEEIQKKKEEGLEKLKSLNIFNDTVMQDSGWKGVHFFYQYEEDIPKCSFDYEGLHFDVENDGGYILIEPSTFAGKTRKITGDTLTKMSPELKEKILSHTNVSSNEQSQEIDSDENSIIKGLDGRCNSTFVKVGGIFRKFMNVRQTEQSLNVINKYMLDDPMDSKSMRAMCQQIEKYHKADVDTISQEIMNHMKIVKDAHVRDLRECLGYDRKDLEQAVRFLCDHKKLHKIKKDLYRLVEDIEWQEDFLSLVKPLNFEIPYFEKYACFNQGSMIVIGAKSGVGKTHINMNIMKQLIDAGHYPYLLSTEGGGGFAKIAQTIGLKEGDFAYKVMKDPSVAVLKPNAVTIIDWLKAPDGEYAKTDVMYEKINEQLIEKGGLCIIFAQLKKESGGFYAENMVEFYASLVAKFLYPTVNGVTDNLKPYFHTTKIRDSKIGKQYVDISLTFNPDTKILEMRK